MIPAIETLSNIFEILFPSTERYLCKPDVLCRTPNALWHWILWIGSWTLPRSKKTLLEYFSKMTKTSFKEIHLMIKPKTLPKMREL